LKLVHFKLLDQFSSSFFKIHEFSHFNQILLDLFNVYTYFRIIFELFILLEIVTSHLINKRN